MVQQVVQNILMFQKLSQYKAEQIYQVINGEPHTTVGIILSKFKPDLAKEVLKYFSPDDQKEIVFKMATAKNVAPEAINSIANVLGEKLRVFDDDDKTKPMGGNEKMAEILKKMGPGKSEALLEALKGKDPGMADRLKKKMFEFTDIVDTDPESLKRSLARVNIDTLALSMKGEKDDMLLTVAKALSENRRKILIGELKAMGPKKRTEVDLAKNEILIELRDAYDKGILRMKGDKSDDEWIM